MRNHSVFPKIILGVMTGLMLTSCLPAEMKKEEVPHTAASSAVSGSSSVSEQAKYRLVSSPDGMIYTGGAMSDDGFYELVFTKDVISGAQNIVYTDFASKHRIYLSSDINSDHQNENDTSYIPTAIGGAAILTDNEYIYVLKKGSLLLQDVCGTDAKACIYRTDLDGGNRIALEIPFDETINGTSGIFSDGESLLLLIDSVDKNSKTYQKLVRADFSMRNITTLIDFSNTEFASQSVFLVGSFGNKLILSTLKFDDNGELTKELYAIDPLEGTIEQLIRFSDSERYAFFQHNNIYYIEMSENALYRFDPSKGESERIIPKLAPPDLEYDTVQIGYAAPEPYLAFRFNSDENSTNYYWNCDTGEWKKELLTDGAREVHIYGIWQDHFLVMLEDEMVFYQDFAPNGQAYTNQMAVAKHALISQEDYWNGVPNYIYFQDDVYGNGEAQNTI